jgi:hypothetical protein
MNASRRISSAEKGKCHVEGRRKRYWQHSVDEVRMKLKERLPAYKPGGISEGELSPSVASCDKR